MMSRPALRTPFIGETSFTGDTIAGFVGDTFDGEPGHQCSDAKSATKAVFHLHALRPVRNAAGCQFPAYAKLHNMVLLTVGQVGPDDKIEFTVLQGRSQHRLAFFATNVVRSRVQVDDLREMRLCERPKSSNARKHHNCIHTFSSFPQQLSEPLRRWYAFYRAASKRSKY